MVFQQYKGIFPGYKITLSEYADAEIAKDTPATLNFHVNN